MSFSDSNKTIYLNNELPLPTNNVPLLTLVWFKQDRDGQDAIQTVKRMFRYSCGPYGENAVIGGDARLSWGILLPDNFTPLTCWSHYSNNKELCLFEGDMYDDLPSIKLLPGDNPELAMSIASHMQKKPAEQMKGLNGIYSGIYINRDCSCAYAFNDPTGTRSVYYHSDNQRFVVTNNFWAFRGLDGFNMQWDKTAITQILTFGYPMKGRTTLEGVRLLQPGNLIGSYKDGRTSLTNVLQPVERKSWSFKETVNTLRENMDETMKRICKRLESPFGLGLSGGLDSRICLASLHSQGINYQNFTYYSSPDAADNCLAKDMSEHLKNHHISIKLDSKLAYSLYRDNYIINESGSPGFAFLLLAAGAQQYVNTLIIGSECIRDTPMGPYWTMSIKNKSELANCLLKAELNNFTASQALKILAPSYSVSWQDLLDEWHDSFNQIDQQTVFDVFLDHSLNQRVQRRTRPRLEAVRWFCNPVYPYMDNKLYSAFRSVPLKYMEGEKAHIELLRSYNTGIEQFPNAARRFAGVPLDKEYKYRRFVHLGRALRFYFSPINQKWRETKGRLGLGAKENFPLLEEEINSFKDCEIFNWSEVNKIFDQAKSGTFVNRNAYHKLMYLLMINDLMFGNGFTGNRSLKFLKTERKICFKEIS